MYLLVVLTVPHSLCFMAAIADVQYSWNLDADKGSPLIALLKQALHLRSITQAAVIEPLYRV